MHKITVIVGSLRKESFNRKLAQGLAELGKDLFDFELAEIGNLPLFNEDLEKNFPAEAQALKDSISKSDGVLLVTPEYNRSMPGPLKNALDWASRPYGKGALTGKCAASIGMSPGPTGTAVCQSQARSLLTFLGAVQMALPEVYLQYTASLFDEKGRLVDERCKNHLMRFLNSFSAFVGKHK
jgi:chromate reductase